MVCEVPDSRFTRFCCILQFGYVQILDIDFPASWAFDPDIPLNLVEIDVIGAS